MNFVENITLSLTVSDERPVVAFPFIAHKLPLAKIISETKHITRLFRKIYYAYSDKKQEFLESVSHSTEMKYVKIIGDDQLRDKWEDIFGLTASSRRKVTRNLVQRIRSANSGSPDRRAYIDQINW